MPPECQSEFQREPLLRRMDSPPMPSAFFPAEQIWSRPDFFSPELCRSSRQEALSCAKQRQGLITPEQANLYDPEVRSTQLALVGRSLQARVTQLLMSLRAELGGIFGLELTACQRPQFLVYRPGDFFQAHSDLIRDTALKSRQRKLSAVVFLNGPQDAEQPFTGGELVLYTRANPAGEFEGYPLLFQTGQLLIFRSDLIHEVRPVLAGIRCSVVSWYY